MFEHITRTIASLILLQIIMAKYPNSLQAANEYPKGGDKSAHAVAKAATPRTNTDKTNHPSPEEILLNYERSLVVMREKVSFVAELEQTLNGAFTYKAKKYKHRRVVHRDGTRFGLSRESKRFDDQNKMIGHDCLTSIHGIEKAMITQNPYGQPPEHLRIDFRPRSFMDRFLANLGTGRLLDSVTYGAHNKTFFEVMSEANSLQLKDEMEVVDGHKTYVLEAETKYGKHILWIDPEYGYNARRMAIHKVTGDYDFDTKLGDQPRPLPPNVNPSVPWCATVKSDLTVDNIRIEKVDGRYVPVSATIRDYEKFEDGRFTEIISNYKRSDIDFNPDFDAMVRNFLEEVPDETKVYVYYEQSSTATYKWQKGQVVDFRDRKVDYKPKKFQSLLDKPLPGLEGFGVRLSEISDSNSIIVICFWDMNQRPSRNCVQQLSKRAKELKAKGVDVVVVQASKVDESDLNEWVEKNNIPFPVGMIQDNEEQTRFNWGVKSLPWLIQTDSSHIVTAEGFGLDELDSGIEEIIQHISSVRKISGVVSAITGEPQKGVEIKIVPARSGLSTSNAEGRFNLEYEPKINAGPETDYYLSARHEALNLAVYQLIDENTKSVELRLEPAVTLTGTVVDTEGGYVAGAEVRVLMRGANWKGSITYATTHTDANGFFKFKAISTELPISNVIVTAKGYCQHFINRVDIQYAKNDIKLKTITLHEANLSVSGVVVDVNDQPVSGAIVKVLGGGEPRTDTITDSDGRFKVEKLGRGGIRIIAKRSGNIPLEGIVDSQAGVTGVKVKLTEVYKSPQLPGSKVGKSLSDINNLNIGSNTRTFEGSAILLCFFDMQQRPSRNCITQIVKRLDELKQKGVIVVAIQASNIDKNTLDEWVEKNNIPFPVGMIQDNEEKTRFSWGVKSLPWLILTDREHVVITEGFGLDEMDNMIEEM